MLAETLKNDLLDTFSNQFDPPFSGSIAQWAEKYIDVQGDVGVTGPFKISNSPWLTEPLRALKDPKVEQINICSAVQTAKNLCVHLAVCYWAVNDFGPTLILNQSDRDAEYLAVNRLYPLFTNCPLIKPLLDLKRYTTTTKQVKFPKYSLTVSGINKNIVNSRTVRYLWLDEIHAYEDISLIEKAISRTNYFTGRRKIIITSQPDEVGSALHKHYTQGSIYEWNWLCPSCKKYQAWRWQWQREDKTFAGINWDTILNKDNETTNIALSSDTACLECYYCKHQVKDSPTNRRLLNDTGKYVCIKNDGDSGIVSYTWPGFVNIQLSFKGIAAKYLNAKRQERLGLSADIITFEQQILGKFYRQGIEADHSKLMRGDYTPDPNDKNADWVNFMGVDLQRREGEVKYYVVRAGHKNGVESRRLACGVCRTFDEIDAIAKKWNVKKCNVGVDSGDGPRTKTVYQECIRRGEVHNLPNGSAVWLTWQPFKGDKKLSYDNHIDKVSRYYSPISKQDPLWPIESKFKGIMAQLVLWSNYSIKTMLAQLRDGKLPNIKWLVDSKDDDYEKQMYSEGLVYKLDKKTGKTKAIWIENEDNHFWDCEAMILTLFIMSGVFSPTKINEDELLKAITIDAPKEETAKI